MNTLRILILEDDLRTLSFLINRIGQLEEKIKDKDIAVTVLSEYTQVEEYINNTKMDFDIILLDRDCKSCGSFHVLDFEKFGLDKIISISAIPEWNKEAEERGVKKVIFKDLKKLEEFSNEVIEEIKVMTKGFAKIPNRDAKFIWWADLINEKDFIRKKQQRSIYRSGVGLHQGTAQILQDTNTNDTTNQSR